MKRIMRYWLEAGADGFRVDMASSLVKRDPGYRQTMAWWREVRAMCDRDYPEAALISEWSSPRHAIAAGFHVDFLIHFNGLAYTTLFRHERSRDIFGVRARYGHSFFDRSGRGSVAEFLRTYLRHFRLTRRAGYISIPSGNHDIGRLSEGRTVAELKVIFTFLLTLPGVPCIYYGDEIGLRHVHGLPSKEGGYGRTGARTPMQWTSGRNAGFSNAPGRRLYLPVDPRRSRPTVEDQEHDPGSLLNHIRRLATLRRRSAALGAEGDFRPIIARPNSCPFVFLRSKGDDRFLVAVNPSAGARAVRHPLGTGSAESCVASGTTLRKRGATLFLRMRGYSYGVFRLAP
jgi:maltose alpha-D-glucosyltransferase/alpha-amylase